MRAFESNPAMAFIVGFHDDGADFGLLAAIAADDNLGTHPRSFARPQHHPPIVLREFFEQKDFKLAAGMRIGSAKPRWNDTGVIQDENLAGTEIIDQVAKLPVCDLAGVAVYDKKPGVVAVWGRRLGNEFVREVKVELGCEHVVNIFELAGRLNRKRMVL